MRQQGNVLPTSHAAHGAQAGGVAAASAAPSDFLAVIDLQPDTPGGRYGRVIATVPVGERRQRARLAAAAQPRATAERPRRGHGASSRSGAPPT